MFSWVGGVTVMDTLVQKLLLAPALLPAYQHQTPADSHTCPSLPGQSSSMKSAFQHHSQTILPLCFR